jgi:hypothetical protein
LSRDETNRSGNALHLTPPIENFALTNEHRATIHIEDFACNESGMFGA